MCISDWAEYASDKYTIILYESIWETMLWLMTEYILGFSHLIKVSKGFSSKRSQSLPSPLINRPNKHFPHHAVSVYIELGWYSPTRPYMKLMSLPRDTSDPYYQSVGSMSRDPYAVPYWRLPFERVPNHYKSLDWSGFIPSSHMPCDVIRQFASGICTFCTSCPFNRIFNSTS